MQTSTVLTAFLGQRFLATGDARTIAEAVQAAQDPDGAAPLIFDDHTGRQVDLDFRVLTGAAVEVANPAADEQENPPRSPGRPRLGVVAKEVTLLPRHWDWLAGRPSGASAELRKLVEMARREDARDEASRLAAQAADRFMVAMLGNEPGYEEAARALYAGDRPLYHKITENWPTDARDYARKLAEPAFRFHAPNPSGLDSKELVIHQFENAWALAAYHLGTLTTEECLWRPTAQSLQLLKGRHGRWKAQWPTHEGYDIGPPSIGWITWHMCFWWTKALAHLQGEVNIEREDVSWPGSAEGVRAELNSLRGRWLQALISRPEKELGAVIPTSWPIPDSSTLVIAAWLNVELTKNASELGLMRFVYATRAGVRNGNFT